MASHKLDELLEIVKQLLADQKKAIKDAKRELQHLETRHEELDEWIHGCVSAMLTNNRLLMTETDKRQELREKIRKDLDRMEIFEKGQKELEPQIQEKMELVERLTAEYAKGQAKYDGLGDSIRADSMMPTIPSIEQPQREDPRAPQEEMEGEEEGEDEGGEDEGEEEPRVYSLRSRDKRPAEEHPPLSMSLRKRRRRNIDDKPPGLPQPKRRKTGPKQTLTIEFDDLFHGTEKDKIVRYQGEWYILRCEEHNRSFKNNAYPKSSAAEHGRERHYWDRKDTARAIREFGVRVLNCNEEKCKKNNTTHCVPYKPDPREEDHRIQSVSVTPGQSQETTLRSQQDSASLSHPPSSICEPLVGELLLARRKGRWHAVAILPQNGPFDVIGFSGSIKDTGFLLRRSIPVCYDYDESEQIFLGWSKEYQNGTPGQHERAFPVLYFDPDQPLADVPFDELLPKPLPTTLGWVAAKDLAPFEETSPENQSARPVGYDMALAWEARMKTVKAAKPRLLTAPQSSSPPSDSAQDCISVQGPDGPSEGSPGPSSRHSSEGLSEVSSGDRPDADQGSGLEPATNSASDVISKPDVEDAGNADEEEEDAEDAGDTDVAEVAEDAGQATGAVRREAPSPPSLSGTSEIGDRDDDPALEGQCGQETDSDAGYPPESSEDWLSIESEPSVAEQSDPMDTDCEDAEPNNQSREATDVLEPLGSQDTDVARESDPPALVPGKVLEDVPSQLRQGENGVQDFGPASSVHDHLPAIANSPTAPQETSIMESRSLPSFSDVMMAQRALEELDRRPVSPRGDCGVEKDDHGVDSQMSLGRILGGLTREPVERSPQGPQQWTDGYFAPTVSPEPEQESLTNGRHANQTIRHDGRPVTATVLTPLESIEDRDNRPEPPSRRIKAVLSSRIVHRGRSVVSGNASTSDSHA